MIYYPFIKEVRRLVYQHDPESPVPNHLKVSAWTDGGIPQLKAITRHPFIQEMDKNLLIERNKHSASCSGVQQPADLQSLFRGIKRESKLVTAEGTYCELLSDQLRTHFKKTNVIRVEQRKIKGAVDLLACLPSILTKLAIPKSITQGPNVGFLE